MFPLQEDTLSDLAKKAGGFAIGALIGKGGSKFRGLDIKRVYFGFAYSLYRLHAERLTPIFIEIGSAITVRFVRPRTGAVFF